MTMIRKYFALRQQLRLRCENALRENKNTKVLFRKEHFYNWRHRISWEDPRRKVIEKLR